MSSHRLPGSVQLLASELLDHLIRTDATRRAGQMVPGSFVKKTIRGADYWYLQTSIGGDKSQTSLGPDSEPLRRWMAEVRQTREQLEDEAPLLRRLVRMLVEGGATHVEPGLLRILEILEQAGVFRAGGVLVGTHALAVYGPMLGVRWKSKDVDIAHDPAIGIGLLETLEPTNVPEVLRDSGLGFFAVPALDPREPSTSFSIRGEEIRVDFLTPLYGRESEKPVYLPALKVSAHPLRMIDYLLREPQQGFVLGRRTAVLVNVPHPGRFALHKLWVSTKREPTFRAKSAKDLAQAATLLEVLLRDSPGDVEAAWEALDDRPNVRRAVRRTLPTLTEHGLSDDLLADLTDLVAEPQV